MLKNLEKTINNVKKRKIGQKKIEIRQKCRKPGKTMKNVEKPVKNLQKYRKIVKNFQKQKKTSKKKLQFVKNFENLGKPLKMSKNR